MPVSTTKSKNTHAAGAGGGVVKGNHGTGKNGSAEERGTAAAIIGNGLHLLANQLKSLTLFEIGMKGTHHYGYGKWNKNVMSIVDTEAKQLQCISDLYAIVKAQPKYKTLKDPVWKEDTDPMAVITWLLKKLGPLANGENWTIDTWNDGRKLRYRFVVFKYYPNNLLRDDECYVPLDFLPKLKSRDLALHDLIIDTIALVSKINKVPLWDEDGDFSEGLKGFLKDADKVRKKGNSVLSEMYESYSKGDAYQYLQLVKRRRKTITVKALSANINDYTLSTTPFSDRKRYMVWILRRGLEMADSGKKIADYSYVPQFADPGAITPYRLYKFIWSRAEIDPVKARSMPRLDKDEEIGVFEPMMFTMGYPGRVMKPLENAKFPVLQYSFMNEFIKHIRSNTYIDYYYKRIKLREPEGMQLLDRLDRAELENEINNS